MLRRLLVPLALFTLSLTAAIPNPLKTPEDRVVSPFTGYTREHWLEITEKLIAGVLPYFDEDRGVPVLRGVPSETRHFEMLTRGEREREAFGRTMMLVAIYTAATGHDTIPGYSGSISAPYLRGLIQGADPNSPYRWKPSIPQSVMGTNVAMAILLSPDFFWTPLTTKQREDVLALIEELVERPAYDNNHWYFHLLGVPLLEKYGRTTDRARMTEVFRRVLGWYRGDGWYIDGGARGFDYYNLWGFHLYNNALCHFDSAWEKLFGRRVRETAERFQEVYPYLYGRDGGPIPWGRSITYRFASISAIGYALLNDACFLPPGQARRLASGCLKYFWDHGCLSLNGLLEPGYYGPNSAVAEPYIARSSPYWAAQGLVALALPADHPFWTATEEPMPADGSGGRMALPDAQMVMRVSPVDGEARMYSIGQPFAHRGPWQKGTTYFQHAYSSFLGWIALGGEAPDLLAGRTAISFDGEHWQYRARPRAIRVDPYHCVSSYDIELEAVEPGLEEFGQVITHTLIGNDGEVQIFWHNSARPAFLAIGGYGISIPHGEDLRRDAGEEDITITGGNSYSVIRVLEGPPGSLQAKAMDPPEGYSHSHLFGGKGAFPYWRSQDPVPPNTPIVVYVNGTRGRKPPSSVMPISSGPGRLEIQLEGVIRVIRLPH